MACINPTREQIAALRDAKIEGPVRMLNLLRFDPDGGRERYAAYAANSLPVLTRVGGKVVYQARTRATVIGDEPWDTVLIVEYPSIDAFFALVGDPEYVAGADLRTGALVDSRLVCMQVGVST